MSLLLAFLAGLLTTLSPCVLPVLPLVIGSASSRHRLGPVALCVGLVLAFTTFAISVSLAAKAFNFDPGTLRLASAVLLLLLGITLVAPPAGQLFSRIFTPLASRANAMSVPGEANGLGANFFAGSLLGVIWSPCAGPTLATAITLATQAGTWPQGLALIFVFGLGVSLPLLAVAYGSRSLFQTKREWLISFSGKAKPVFGVILVLVALGALSGWDKLIESTVLGQLPERWVDLITRY